jgi:hypothetical protein
MPVQSLLSDLPLCLLLHPGDTQAEVPNGTIPVVACKVSDGWRVLIPSLTLYSEECLNFPATFQDYVDLLPGYDAMLIQGVAFLEMTSMRHMSHYYQVTPSFLSAMAEPMTAGALLAGSCLTTQDNA